MPLVKIVLFFYASASQLPNNFAKLAILCHFVKSGLRVHRSAFPPFPPYEPKHQYHHNYNRQDGIANPVTVSCSKRHKLLACSEAGYLGAVIAQSEQNQYPRAGTQCCIIQKWCHTHPRQTGGNGNQLPNTGDKHAHKGGNGSALIELTLGTKQL